MKTIKKDIKKYNEQGGLLQDSLQQLQMSKWLSNARFLEKSLAFRLGCLPDFLLQENIHALNKNFKTFR